MAVVGNEQRVYGTLSSSGGCKIWLRRFAIVRGDSSDPSTTTGNVVYGDEVPFKNCGYKQHGYLSILFIADDQTLPYAVMEVRKCKDGKDYIFIETYGEVAPPSFPLNCWFNKGSEDSPDWITLRNPHTSGIMSTVVESTFKFKENKGSSVVTELSCCKECVVCGCLESSCTVTFYVLKRGTTSKISPTYNLGYGLNSPPYGEKTYIWSFSTTPTMTLNDWTCDEIDITMSTNTIYDVYFVDPVKGDTLIGSFEWFRSFGSSSNYEIVVEYTIACVEIRMWCYTLTDETNWELINLENRPIRIYDGTGYYTRGTLSSISKTSETTATFKISNFTQDYIKLQYPAGNGVPSSDRTLYAQRSRPVEGAYLTGAFVSGWCAFQNVKNIIFTFNGALPIKQRGYYGRNYITYMSMYCNSNAFSWGHQIIISDLPSLFTGRYTDPATGEEYMVANNVKVTIPYQYYRNQQYGETYGPAAYNIIVFHPNYTANYEVTCIDMLSATMEFDPQINDDACLCRMMLNQPVYID